VEIVGGIIDAISIETPFFFYKLKTKIKQLGSENKKQDLQQRRHTATAQHADQIRELI
jgi:hypothetical protein